MSDDFSGDSVTDVTAAGWLQRVGQSVIGALFGILLVIASIILLWWNEGRAVEAIRALDRGAHQVVEVKADAVDPGNGGVLAPYRGADGYRIALAEPGFVPAAAMFKDKAHEESVLTWILRAVGFVLMLIGFALIASPLSVLVGVIPLFETLVGAGAFLLALILSVPLTLIVIASAWIAHRPLIGVGLIVVAVALAFALRRLHRRPPPAPTHFLPEGMLR